MPSIRIGVSTRSLFDLEEERNIFIEKGVVGYIELQRNRERDLIEKRAGFSVIERLLKLNEISQERLVEVILLSRNSPDLSLRAFRSIEAYGLDIKLSSFTSGRPVAPFIPPWKIDLFLSNHESDVASVVDAGVAAAKLGSVSQHMANLSEQNSEEVRIVFDGDAVVFSPESDQVYNDHGLEAFFEHERANAQNPMSDGPFAGFLKKLSILRQKNIYEPEVSRVRIGLVTARNAPTHERVIHTLRAWGTSVDEAHFVGPNEKGPVLEAMKAHIFFDDQMSHVLSATSNNFPSGLVPGPHKPDMPIIPASI